MKTTQQYLERRWTALILLCVAQFVVVLDASIVNVALPSIGKGLHFSERNLPWVVNAYVIAFGGFLLLGGRAADLLGRRRVFMAGLMVVAVASLAAGFAASQGQLIAARAAQGLGAAIISPSALSIVTTLFRDGAERNKALGAWGAVAGSAGAAGEVLGGRPTCGPGLGGGVWWEAPGFRVSPCLWHRRGPRRALLPAAGSDDPRRGWSGRPARHPVRLQADPRGRDALRGARARLVQPGVRRGRLPHRHPRPLAARCDRPRIRLRHLD